ncbi:g3013 [Coccomyxa elongata]
MVAQANPVKREFVVRSSQKESRRAKGRKSERSKDRREGFDPLHLTENPERSQFLREAEVLHARWAMLGTMGLVVPDLLGGPLYLLPDLGTQRLIPFTIQLVVAVGVLEAYRGAVRAQKRGLEERAYPGKSFDVLGLTRQRAKAKPEKQGPPGLGVYSAWLGGLPGFLSGAWWYSRREMTVKDYKDMKEKELNNGRLAMISFAGVYAASMVTGKGPITLLLEHVADPMHNTVLQTFAQ